ncbi:hypothetical protein B0F88_10380 [Methylobacter tundripaludum]|uniref:Prophage protein n=1 Tax=Methylobacter tundripaludum TaxID=173365 RepID=A0A2S6H5C1_9GAMM|nr:hypothetical protein [Methylobacter tundripaludum]PPK72647.1 hypothetical protein B0F88_10380 [Methylobacter tundripaludum]
MAKPTLDETLGELDAGIFAQKTHEALKQVAMGVIATGKKGQVSITLDLDRIGDSSSVQIKHTLKFSRPTKNGKTSEENTTSTPMYADNLGYLTISPQTQDDLFKESEKRGNVTKIGG